MKKTDEQRPVFAKVPADQALFVELSKRVNKRLAELPARRMWVVWLKMALFPVIYLLWYVLALLNAGNPGWFILFFILMGFTSVSLFLNLIHEACHGNLLPQARWNRLYYYVFDLLGLNSYIWQVRHLDLHHNYSNISGWDSDIEQSGPLKIYPHPAAPNRFHAVQHIVFPLLYILYLANWIFTRDFKDFFNPDKIVRKAVPRIPVIEYLKLFFFKAFFVCYVFVVPLVFFGVAPWVLISAVASMLIVASIFALLTLLPPHVNVSNQFPLPDAGHRMSTSWFMHQFLTANDVKADNFFTRHVMGNSNYHVVHHLFPNVSSAYAPEITKVVESFAREHKLPYRAYTFREAFRMHYQLISSNARQAGRLAMEN